jgi:hypothetical protein
MLTAATWCSSVGTTWTVELHTRARRTAYGTLVDWITSGIPITQPVPAKVQAAQRIATGYIAGAGGRHNTAGWWPGLHAARIRLTV